MILRQYWYEHNCENYLQYVQSYKTSTTGLTGDKIDYCVITDVYKCSFCGDIIYRLRTDEKIQANS